MQVPFVIVLRFYHPDITDKIDRLIHASGSKMALKMSSVVKQLMYVLNFFRVTAGKIHSFRSVVKKRFGSFIQSIRFWIWLKESISIGDHLDQ